MDGDGRREAVRQYREREVAAGIYAVRCVSSGGVWVGRAPDLSTIRNRLWFTLRQGASPHRSLQAACDEHGIDSLAFDVVESLDDEEPGPSRDRLLKQRLAHWAGQLGAIAL